jgi:predicted PurR-regulated permease PerM
VGDGRRDPALHRRRRASPISSTPWPTGWSAWGWAARLRRSSDLHRPDAGRRGRWLALIVIPTLVQQATDLVQAAPHREQLRTFLTERFPSVMVEDSPLRNSLVSIGETIQSRGAELLQGVLTSAAGVVNILVFLVVVPVVAFYLLLDWDRMVARIDDLLPRDHAPIIRDLAGQIDRTLASFVRGQGTVCLILGTFYAVALMVIGLQFGLVVGLVAGLLTFIPYVGALVGGALSIGLALFQFWGEWWSIIAVALVFQAGSWSRATS